MFNTIFLVSGLTPMVIGIGFLFRPRRMSRLQSRFRKRLERLERRLRRAHRVTGLAFLSVGFVMLLTYFYPVWVFNLFVVVRMVMGVFFPEMFEAIRPVDTTPMVCI